MYRSVIKIKPYCSLISKHRFTSHSSAVKIIHDDAASDYGIFKKGESHHGFEVENIEKVDDFNLTAIMLRHTKTKAEYLHLYRSDSNNVFSINFRTTPKDSTGLPHILEHTVLCGSELFPVRDPFFKMLNRSLSTFMNAMTGSDYTLYPFSTQNLSDFRNLQKIYLDAVFRPNLKLLDFMQEGWRLEHVDPNDPKTDIIIKGVVYNEMKGAFSDNESIYAQKLQNFILPDNTYGVISGGDPLKIPDLTWGDLKAFHKNHYHPSNAKFFSYGDFPLLPTLQYLNDEYLSRCAYKESGHTLVPPQKRWSSPKEEHIICRYENMKEAFEKQNVISVSLLMTDITDVYETFLMQFVTELLIKGPNSPFYKSLIEENFSGGFVSSTGFDTQPRDAIFSVGLQGLDKKDFSKVVALFEKTLDGIIAGGFEQKHIESVLHRYELGIKHESSNFGLHLLLGLTPLWNHGGDLIKALNITKAIEKLRNEIRTDPRYLQNIVKKHFKDNNHRLILSMSPDKEYEKKQLDLEKDLIQQKVKKLTKSDRETVYTQCLELLKEQSKQQPSDLLPTLQMSDINTEVERVDQEKIFCSVVPTQINKVNSNGVTYFRGVLNTSQLTPEQHMLLPLFCNIITKLGTETMNFRDFDSLVNLKTAGLNLSVHVGESLYQLHTYEPGILVSSYCLNKNAESMFELWSQLFNLKQFKDVDRFKMLVQLYVTNLTQGVSDSGHFYAMQAAGALISGVGYQKELLSGLQHISYMKRLINTSSYPAVLQELTNIATILFDKNKLRCALNIEEKEIKAIVPLYEKFVNNLPGNTLNTPNETTYTTTKVWVPTDAINCQHHVLNVPVNFCSKAILTKPYTNPEHAKLRVLARLLSAKYLHPELRERQGAYGGGARVSGDGVFVFYSYRDPRSLETLDVFDGTYNWITQQIDNITPQDLLEAKLGVFQSVDAPVAAGNKGIEDFLKGINTEVLSRHRADIMTVDHKDITNVGEKYFAKNSTALCSKVVIGSKNESMDTRKRSDELWTVFENE